MFLLLAAPAARALGRGPALTERMEVLLNLEAPLQFMLWPAEAEAEKELPAARPRESIALAEAAEVLLEMVILGLVLLLLRVVPRGLPHHKHKLSEVKEDRAPRLLLQVGGLNMAEGEEEPAELLQVT